MKTLKDFKPYMQGTMLAEFDCLKQDLRKEAIKWVKELQDGMPLVAHIDVGRRSQKFTYCMCLGKIRWIIHFFNLTEEDLNSIELEGGKKE